MNHVIFERVADVRLNFAAQKAPTFTVEAL